jgi:serine/threonine protein kinase
MLSSDQAHWRMVDGKRVPCESPDCSSLDLPELEPQAEAEIEQGMHGYKVLGWLGNGAFGQVMKCQLPGHAPVALKVAQSSKHIHQARLEVQILQLLNQVIDPWDKCHIVRMTDYFVDQGHMCIALELLGVSLYSILKQNSFCGLPMALIRTLAGQLLLALQCLQLARVIHCDVKPENILISSTQAVQIKLVDFGSACFEGMPVCNGAYVQSRFYRSPEVLLGLPFTHAIDMWSLGCVAAELYLGQPVFQGCSEQDQIHRILQTLGPAPRSMVEASQKPFKMLECIPEASQKHFGGLDEPKYGGSGSGTTTPSTVAPSDSGDDARSEASTVVRVVESSVEATVVVEGSNEAEAKPMRRGPDFASLEHVINSAKLRDGEHELRTRFLNFLRDILVVDPVNRCSPAEGAAHAFMTEA